MSAPASGTNSEASTAHHSEDPRKILIVDDDSDLTSMFKMALDADVKWAGLLFLILVLFFLRKCLLGR